MRKKYTWLLPLELIALTALLLVAIEAAHADETTQTFSLFSSRSVMPGDGYTQFRVSSERILLPGGGPIPDGTYFTIYSGTGSEPMEANDTTFFHIHTLDQGATKQGVQVTSKDGAIQFQANVGTMNGVFSIRVESDAVEGIVYTSSLPITLESHTPFILDELTLSPESPTATDTIHVLLNGYTPSPSWNVSFSYPQIYTENNQEIIRINVSSVRTVNPDDSVSQVIQSYNEDIVLPALNAEKTYTIRVYQNGTLIKEHVFDLYGEVFDTGFTDINEAYWAIDYIRSLRNDEIISGYNDGTFRPENSITRSELLKIVLKSANIPLQEGENPFADVPDDAWYAPYVITAYTLGIISGQGDQFSPQRPITRAESLKILFRAFEIPTVRVRELSFDDVSGWQTEYVETAVAYDLAQGYGDGTFGPNRSITRAEASKITDRTRKLQADANLVAQLAEPTPASYDAGQERAEFVAAESGKASYYAGSLAGHNTASGVPYDPTLFTAAHRTLPFGTRLEVRIPETENSIEVTVNDRGPYIEGRILDLSSTAFEALAPLSRGVIPIEYQILSE